MHVLHEIKERMDKELEVLCDKESWTIADVELIGEMVDVVKDIDTVYAMKDYEPEDWARGYSYGHNKNHETIEKLEAMMKDARTPEERESYRSAIEHMRRS